MFDVRFQGIPDFAVANSQGQHGNRLKTSQANQIGLRSHLLFVYQAYTRHTANLKSLHRHTIQTLPDSRRMARAGLATEIVELLRESDRFVGAVV
jgi:hypothetical protein